MLLDAMTVSRVISCLYFLMSCFAFFLIILDIYVYSIRCLLSPIPAILRRFATRAVFVMIIIDFCGLLIALATIDALCWIMSVMVSLMVSMSSGSCSVSNRLLNSSWNSIFFYLIRKNKVKASFLYSAVSSLQNRSKRFTLYSPDRPVQSDTISASLGSIQPYATINARRLLVHIAITVYSHVLICTAE